MMRALLPVAAIIGRCGTVHAHGTMQAPLPWQLGNVQEDLGRNSCVSGGCNWFENNSHIPPGQEATIPQHSPLRTFADAAGQGDWTRRNPWRAPGTAPVHAPCGSEGGNPGGCVQADGTLHGRCTTDDGGFGFGADGRDLGGLGVVTSWIQGAIVEASWSLRSNHGGGA